MPFEPILKGLLGGLMGGVIGAYLATSAIRWDKDEGASLGRSHCDACKRPLGWHETVPVISLICLGGRCATCRVPIDRFHALGEVSAALMLATIFAFRPWPEAGLEAAGALTLLWLALIDLKTFRLPNALVLVIATLGLVHAYLSGAIMQNLIIAIGLGCLLAVLAYGLYRFKGRTALGVGDIKLLMALALWLGSGVIYVMMLGSVVGLIHLALVRKPSDTTPTIAFGPALATAALIVAGLTTQIAGSPYG